MKRAYNFSAGPAVLPEEVLQQAAAEMMDYKGSGMSVMELSHRSKWFEDILEAAKDDLRDLLKIPENYEILFLQGGAHLQFSMIPLNFSKNNIADYIITGQWAKKAHAEAGKFLTANKIASSEDKTFSYIPDCSDLDINPKSDYVYICENNTIYGTKYHKLPNTKGRPLVADISSCFLSEPMNVKDYACLYGGAQKNLGPAGVTIVILDPAMINDKITEHVPTMLRYSTFIENNSLYNTPPTYGIYICGLVFKWLKNQGGLDSIQKKNMEKANLLYDFLDNSSLFKGTVAKDSRSLMNVPFVTGNDDLDAKFIKEATANNLVNLKGHRSVGGMRASIYNAMSLEGVTTLVDFMKKFETENK